MDLTSGKEAMRSINLAFTFLLLSVVGADAQVVALGASNTRGFDLPLADAWPAKLEGLLRASGRNVSVSNQGINGDISTNMLGRFDAAVPQGTRVLILECCGNDNKNPNRRYMVTDHDGNIRALIGKARTRGIVVVFLADIYQGEKDTRGIAAAGAAGAQLCGAVLQGVPEEHRRASQAGIHADAAGNDIVAHRVLPCVTGALGNAG